MCRPQFATLLLLLALLPGCASPGPRDVSGWAEARGADLMDVFGLRVLIGPGLGLYARVTEVLQFGFIAVGQGELALPSPKGTKVRGFPAFAFGLRGRYGGVWFESSREFMLPGFSSRDYQVATLHERPIQREPIVGYITPHGEHDDWRWEIGAGVHLLLLGVQFELRPLQAVDFLAGLLGYDPAGDDLPGATGSMHHEDDAAGQRGSLSADDGS